MIASICEEKPPYSLEAEQAVLGCILIEPTKLQAVSELITPGDFWHTSHKTIYKIMLAMQQTSKKIDVLTLAEELKRQPATVDYDDPRRDFLTEISGRQYLANLTEAPTCAEFATQYAETIREKAGLRFIMQQAGEAYTLAAREDVEALSAGNGHFNISQMVADLKPSGVSRPLCMADVERETVEWAWHGWIPYGKISMIVGDPGLGKSNLSLDLTARITRGSAMPFNTLPIPPANVLLLIVEDGLADTVRPRLEAAGADLHRVHAYSPEIALELLCNLERLEADIRRYNIRMVVVDPLMAFFPSALDSNKDQHVRRLLSPIAALAHRTGVAFVLIHHPNKAGGAQAVYRAGGSIGIIGAARVALLVAQDPDDPEKRILASLKNNLCKAPQALRFHLEAALDIESDPDAAPPRLVWESVADEHSATSLLNTSPSTTEEPEARHEAIEFLLSSLADGPVKSADVERAAISVGISKATLTRARKKLGVKARRVGKTGKDGSWELYLPVQADETFAEQATVSIPNENTLKTLTHPGKASKEITRETMNPLDALDVSVIPLADVAEQVPVPCSGYSDVETTFGELLRAAKTLRLPVGSVVLREIPRLATDDLNVRVQTVAGQYRRAKENSDDAMAAQQWEILQLCQAAWEHIREACS